MDQSPENMPEEFPIYFNFATSCFVKFDSDLAPYLDIKRETLTSPILLACMKDEKLFENDEQNLKPLFTNDLLNHKMNEITKEVQTPVTSLVPNVKVEVEETPVSTFVPNVKFEVEDYNFVTTQLISGQGEQMKFENITNLPHCQRSNNLKEGENEVFILKKFCEGSKAKYLNEATKEFTQTSDNINVYNGTKNSEGDNSEKDVLENVEKDKKENSKKCVQNQSDTGVQVVAKIVQTDCTNKDDDKGNCYYCGTTSESKWHAKCHELYLVRNVPAFSCNFCKKKFKFKRSLTDHKKTHTGDGVVCDGCGKLLFGQNIIWKHRQEHSHEKSHVCSICFKSFTTVYSLRHHMDIHTGQTKKYLCHICGLLCLKTYYTNHIKMHSNIIKCICDKCGRSFLHGDALRKHLRTHIAEINYICAVCNKGSKTRGQLIQHIQTKHAETLGLSVMLRVPQKLSCVICSKMLSCKPSLNRHMEIHKGEKKYQCTVCSEKYNTKMALTKHSQIHKEGKKFQCAICSKRFLEKYQIIKHLISHSRERNHICDLCNKTFMYSSDLYKHKSSKHGKK